MKFVVTFLIIGAVFCGSSASAQQTMRPFTVTMQGTTHFTDVEAVQTALSRAPNVFDVYPTRVGQGLTELSGNTVVSPEQLVADLTGAISERFEVQSSGERNGRIAIVLKKLPAATSPSRL